MQIRMLLCGLTFAVLGIFVIGCGPKESKEPTSPEQPSAAPAGHEMHGDNHADEAASAADEANPNLAQLSDADRLSAEKQGICPVSERPLGAMGVPVKVDVNGQSVWICCPGCKDKLLADPEKYLAKLKK